MAGIYVHIPFCKSRCIYCGFYSTTGKEQLMDRYFSCILEELHLRRKYIKNDCVRTLYMGGGTPSLLPVEQTEKLTKGIFDIFGNIVLEEFTIECNPDDVTSDYAKGLKRLGVNRVSMGVQTFSDERLKFLKRRHNNEDIEQAVRNLREAGIGNISIDLMFGFPDETLEEWETDIDAALSLNVEHISAYSLMYEEGTLLYRMLEEGKINQIDEESSRVMYEKLIEKLEESGYEHYEISNFAKPGYRSKHNSSYWHDVPYIGLGASAHSYNGKSRQWNTSNLSEYIKSIESGVIPYEDEKIDDVTHYNDIITTALRTKEGINLSLIEEPYQRYLIDNSKKAIMCGNLINDKGWLHLSRKGIFISDDVMSDLMWV